MHWIQGILLALCGTATVYYFLCLSVARAFFRRPRPLDPEFSPPVTILKPVRGADAEAYANFAAFCRLDYPRYQLLFGTMDANDPVLPLIERLRAEFPEREIDLVVCEEALGENRKVSNLRNMTRQARYDLLLISDADMRVAPDYLRRVVQPFRDQKTGLVTCPYRGTAARTPAALLEALHIGGDFIPSTVLSERLEGARFAFGATIAFPRAVLDAIGGWEAIADYLADDYQLGNRTAAAGFAVCLSDYLVDSILPPAGWREVLRRRLRWARTVKACRPGGYAGTLVTYGSIHALLFLLATGFAPSGWLVYGAVAAVRILTARGIAGYASDRSVRRWCWLLPLADLLGFGIWCASYGGNRVFWRGIHYRLQPGGKLRKV